MTRDDKNLTLGHYGRPDQRVVAGIRPELVTELGGDPAILIARAGIDPAVSGARDHYIRFSALAALLTLCVPQN